MMEIIGRIVCWKCVRHNENGTTETITGTTLAEWDTLRCDERTQSYYTVIEGPNGIEESIGANAFALPGVEMRLTLCKGCGKRMWSRKDAPPGQTPYWCEKCGSDS